VRLAEASRPEPLKARLEALAAPLRGLSMMEAARLFEVPIDAPVLKTTLSLCPQ
jgi:hypothetical protein